MSPPEANVEARKCEGLHKAAPSENVLGSGDISQPPGTGKAVAYCRPVEAHRSEPDRIILAFHDRRVTQWVHARFAPVIQSRAPCAGGLPCLWASAKEAERSSGVALASETSCYPRVISQREPVFGTAGMP